MAEHHSKTTIQATYWCAKCGQGTLHTVADGRKGSCLTCLDRLGKVKHPEPPARQESLF